MAIFLITGAIAGIILGLRIDAPGRNQHIEMFEVTMQVTLLPFRPVIPTLPQ